MPTKPEPKPYIHIRSTPADIAALDRIAEAWSQRRPTGRVPSRSEVVRTLIDEEITRLDATPSNGKRPRKKSQESTR